MIMKVIKLDRRFKAYKFGYTHAIKFPDFIDSDARKVASAFHDMYGWDYCYEKPYKGFYGKRDKDTGHRPQYFAVKNESMITQVLLKMER
jgi:hypothetical protein